MSIKFNCQAADDEFDGPVQNGNWGLNTQKRPTAIDENHFKIKGHILGPQTVKIGKWFDDFKHSLQKEKIPKKEEDQMEVYFLLNMKVQKNNRSVQNHIDVI